MCTRVTLARSLGCLHLIKIFRLKNVLKYSYPEVSDTSKISAQKDMHFREVEIKAFFFCSVLYGEMWKAHGHSHLPFRNKT